MDIKHLHSTRFLPLPLVAALMMALSGCATSPDEDEWEAAPVVADTAPPVTAERVSQPVELKPEYPERYVVVRGDTLWDISARFLKDPWMWPSLWHSNPHIANPHLIYPGDILSIIFVGGRPQLQVVRNGEVINAPVELPPEVMQSGQSYPTVRLSPRIREEGLENAIPTIPIDAIGPFLSRPRVVAKDELERAPYIVAHSENRMMSGDGYKVYARGLDEGALQGDYLVVRTGKVYRNPNDEKDVLGYEAVYLGEARLTRFGDPSTMVLTDSSREILRGDRLIPKGDEIIQHSYLPRAPEHPVDGQIISMLEGINMIGQYQVVVLNLGRQDDIETGHVLAVNQKGQKVRDIVSGEKAVELPTERGGTVMVFRVFDRVSYALVMEVEKPLRLLDQVTNP